MALTQLISCVTKLFTVLVQYNELHKPTLCQPVLPVTGISDYLDIYCSAAHSQQILHLSAWATEHRHVSLKNTTGNSKQLSAYIDFMMQFLIPFQGVSTKLKLHRSCMRSGRGSGREVGRPICGNECDTPGKYQLDWTDSCVSNLSAC